jgi:hypothetical protein
LDVSGWDALYDVPTVFQNWEDDGAVRDEYYADIIRSVLSTSRQGDVDMSGF